MDIEVAPNGTTHYYLGYVIYRLAAYSHQGDSGTLAARPTKMMDIALCYRRCAVAPNLR
jgi:hypothetical protein